MKTAAAANLRNRANKSQVKKYIKELRECKDKTEAQTKLNNVISIIDKASQNHLIHKNKAARDKSKLMLHVRKLND
jgi:small subunit ribosomal protein S20